MRASGPLRLAALGLAFLGLVGCGASSARSQQAMLVAQGVPAQGVAAAGTPGASPVDPTVPVDPATRSAVSRLAGSQAYRLAPGDLIDVKFPYHPEENERVPVRPDGQVGLQSAGDVLAAGLTVDELERAIVDRSSRTLRNPVVSVVIVQLAEHKVYVGGDVAKPGYVVYRAGLTPLQAIIERGGFIDTAKTDEVVHIQRRGNQVKADKIDLEEVIEGDAIEQVALAPDDILFVPKTWIGEADVVVDQWIRGLLPTVPRPGLDITTLAF
jgi:protein involved in polysaccharide export with SLBB domain